MKTTHRFPRRRAARANAARRSKFLAAFDRSGVSAAAFARQHSLSYTTFCGWRQRRANAKPSPVFVPVELPPPAAPTLLTIELGTHARLPIHSAAQIDLAARLLQAFNAKSSC